MATSDRAQVLAAIAKYGPSVQALAEKRYGISGEALLAKLAQGESGAISDPTAARNKVSSAGARGWTQFTSGSRREAISRYGIDPWASPDAAFHAASLHLRGKINGSTGLEGYNPGSSSYPAYILGQHVGDVHGSAARSTPRAVGSGAATSSVGVGAAAPDPLGTAFDAGATSASGNLSALLRQAQPQQVAAGSLPAAPSFAAAPPLPQGYQAPPSGGGPQPVQDQVLPQESDLSLPDITAAAAPDAGGPAASGSVSGIERAGSALVTEARARADTLDAKHLPYLWGGGHGGRVNVANTGPLDCSGAVSAVLGIDPRVSGDFERFGSPGRARGGRGINIYANKTHVIMEIDGHFFGTSQSNAGGGAGWIPRAQLSSEYLARFTIRHLAKAG